MIKSYLTFSLLLVFSLITKSYAWGAAGHQIIGAIAEMHLHPSALSKVKDILPDWTKGHLAPIAAWPDRVRGQFPWSSTLHYITPLEDYPPVNCTMNHGVKTERNVLNAIANYTDIVERDESDIPLRFLVHFVGDAHQPLHLTGRDKGGNTDSVLFEGRHMNLHSLWDTGGITKAIREMTNYTKPLPASQIEDVLVGSIYDHYVRWILWEGVKDWWFNDLEEWLTCDLDDDPSELIMDQNNHQQTVLRPEKPQNQQKQKQKYFSADCFPVWAEPIQKFNCEYAFPEAPFGEKGEPAPELNTKEYWGRVQNDKIIESLLAKAGLRLAALLNSILADSEQISEHGLINFDWIHESQSVMSSKMWSWFGSRKNWF